MDPSKYFTPPLQKYKKLGDLCNQRGKVASFLFAGGMGSRLNLFGSKGCFPITPFEKKSFFQLFFEKASAFETRFSVKLEVGVMLSSKNKKEVLSFLQKNHYFSFSPSQITFFEQEDLFCLDEKRKKLSVKAPAGNGSSVFLLRNSNWLSSMQKKGVEYIHFIPVDNPLLDPFSSILTGALVDSNWEVAIAGVKRKKGENIGTFVFKRGKIEIVDYMEASFVQEKGLFGNMGQYCISLPWLLQSVKRAKMPIHWVKKRTEKEGKEVFKGERFFFDLFKESKKVGVVGFKNRLFFAPLKKEKDIKMVQKALQKRDKILLEKISQKKGKGPYELGAPFFYPTEELLKKWKEKKLPETGYIAS